MRRHRLTVNHEQLRVSEAGMAVLNRKAVRGGDVGVLRFPEPVDQPLLLLHYCGQVNGAGQGHDAGGPPCSHVVAVLDRHLDDLQVHIKELTAVRNEVRGLRERANTLDPANCSDDDICHVIPSQHIS